MRGGFSFSRAAENVARRGGNLNKRKSPPLLPGALARVIPHFFSTRRASGLIRAVFAVLFVAACFPPAFAEGLAVRRVVSDLPPLILNGGVKGVEIFVETADLDLTALRTCQQFAATCAVVGSAEGRRGGFVCKGDAADCWRQFIRALISSGVQVLISPSTRGGSFVFNFGGAAAVVSPDSEADDE